MIKERTDLYLYETVVDCFEFLIWPLLKHEVPAEKREGYKSEVIKSLEEYTFVKKSKKDPPHPNSMSLKRNRKMPWSPLDYRNPKDVARAVLTIINPYYVADTQNRVKKKLEENL